MVGRKLALGFAQKVMGPEMLLSSSHLEEISRELPLRNDLSFLLSAKKSGPPHAATSLDREPASTAEN